MEERLTELEIRFMQQESTLDELNGIVCRQDLIISRLEREVARLKEQLNLALPSLTLSPDEEQPPPHY